jgi:hypothetical protein
MVDVAERAGTRAQTPPAAKPRRPLPSWVITVASLVVLLGAWEIFGRDVNPVFGLVSERHRRRRLAARAQRQAVDGAARQPAAVLSGYGLAISSACRSG